MPALRYALPFAPSESESWPWCIRSPICAARGMRPHFGCDGVCPTCGKMCWDTMSMCPRVPSVWTLWWKATWCESWLAITSSTRSVWTPGCKSKRRQPVRTAVPLCCECKEKTHLGMLNQTVWQQSLHADAVCVHHARDLDFATEQLNQPATTDVTLFPLWNTTSLGNVAYLSLYSPTKRLRARYNDIREQFVAWKHYHCAQQQIYHTVYAVFGAMAVSLILW